jgi:hypothetical protein
VYIFIRADLSVPQKIVQASHAALEAGFLYSPPSETCSIIVLEVVDKDALYEVSKRLDRYGIDHTMFFEPDFGMGHSAIATRPILKKSERYMFSKYNLFRG